jgi:hypothetical protein
MASYWDWSGGSFDAQQYQSVYVTFGFSSPRNQAHILRVPLVAKRLYVPVTLAGTSQCNSRTEARGDI